ncbi:MAG: Esterase [Pseudonocardiales bacterium]|nr:Esterase [Pseudonocardiales bacterium]
MNRGTRPDAALIEIRARAESMAGPAVNDPSMAVLESSLNGVPVLRYRPDSASGRRLIWFHGGGYRLGSVAAFGTWNYRLATACDTEVIAVDYRLAPEHPFPEALVDAVLAYVAVLPEAGPLLVGGESAGGGLAAALLLEIVNRGLPDVAGAILCSPWLDLRNGAASFSTNAGTDQLFPQASADTASALYRAGHPAGDPLVSPLLGDWSGRPPILVQASAAESLRDDATHFSEVCPSARLELYEGLAHAWHIGYPDAPGSVEAVASIRRFIFEVTNDRGNTNV